MKFTIHCNVDSFFLCSASPNNISSRSVSSNFLLIHCSYFRKKVIKMKLTASKNHINSHNDSGKFAISNIFLIYIYLFHCIINFTHIHKRLKLPQSLRRTIHDGTYCNITCRNALKLDYISHKNWEKRILNRTQCYLKLTTFLIGYILYHYTCVYHVYV